MNGQDFIEKIKKGDLSRLFIVQLYGD